MRYFNFDLTLAKSLPHGLHKATLNGVSCFLYSDKLLDDENPGLCLIETGFLSDDQVKALICKDENYKKQLDVSVWF